MSFFWEDFGFVCSVFGGLLIVARFERNDTRSAWFGNLMTS